MTEGKYFSVGERAGLVSVNHPELNGEYVIEDCLYGYFENILTDIGGYGYSYILQGISNLDNEEVVWWCQSALRKLHKPSTDSFDEMMIKLTDKVGEEIC